MRNKIFARGVAARAYRLPYATIPCRSRLGSSPLVNGLNLCCPTSPRRPWDHTPALWAEHIAAAPCGATTCWLVQHSFFPSGAPLPGTATEVPRCKPGKRQVAESLKIATPQARHSMRIGGFHGAENPYRAPESHAGRRGRGKHETTPI